MKITSEIAPSSVMHIAEKAALAGASEARAKQLAGLNPQQKSSDADDLVTEGDEAAQRAILALLPETLDWKNKREPVGMLAEEKHTCETQAARLRWVVDPIDGTLPYSRGSAFWCVSIALQEQEDDGWISRLGMVYQASQDDTAERLGGRLFSTDGCGTMLYDLKTDTRTKLSAPSPIAREAELGASAEFCVWANAEFTKRGITTRFRRSICHAVTEMLLGNVCAVVQDAGPLEWDVAAILPIARLAGAHVLARRVDSVAGCDRYATVLAWDKELFDVFCNHLPYAIL